MQLAEHFGRRGVLVLISDLYDDPDTIVRALGPLRFRGNDLIVFHVLDPAELAFSFDDATTFEDLETGEQLPVVPEKLADRYRALVQEHIAQLTAKCAELRVDYALFDTSRPLDHALVSYLSARERMTRVR
jgi:hypothetical protein